ncbi:MAG TPA: methionine biosynthesis protein MetW [Anaerolineaceae bacterium]|nr:methionine biosynthesis protein MetW [Anaerolineaceae bacterium]
MAKSIMVDLKPAKVIDAGCGTGALINELKILGCQVSGLEYSDTAIKLCLARGLDVQKFNLERDFIPTRCEYDVSISLEVAEHLSEDFSDHYVELLTNLAPVLVFSAAPPGQFGFGHINEQPAEYWIKKFKNCNFEFDHELSMKWRKNWADSHKVTWWYYQNLMIFRKS